jgi:hypothetical protein
MDDAFIVVSVISGLFGIMGLLILDRNWFRRERFKFEQDTLKKQNSLQFKKMARELGLDAKSAPPNYRASAPTSLLENAGPLLNLAKNLNPDQIAAVADILGGGTEAPESEGLGGIEGLIEFATKNPDLVQGFLGGLNKNKPVETGKGEGFL